MKIEIGNKQYDVQIADTEEDQIKGLQNVTDLPEDQGMLFIFNVPDTISFWMKDTKISLDIIFINEDEEVISVFKGIPEDETLITEDNVKYVLEVNQNSGIKSGDELEILDDDKTYPTMKILFPNGDTQMEIEGGERIFSRKNSKTLIKMANRAYLSKLDKDYKSLGRKIFKYLEIQDNNKTEYVDNPNES